MEKSYNFKTDLAKAKGLGASHTGSHHWLLQRFTSVLNLVLLGWVLCILVQIAGADLSDIIEILQKPYNVLAISLFTINVFYHATLGLQIVVEDYIHCRVMRLFIVLGIKILSIVTAAAVVVAMIYLMTL